MASQRQAHTHARTFVQTGVPTQPSNPVCQCRRVDVCLSHPTQLFRIQGTPHHTIGDERLTPKNRRLRGKDKRVEHNNRKKEKRAAKGKSTCGIVRNARDVDRRTYAHKINRAGRGGRKPAFLPLPLSTSTLPFITAELSLSIFTIAPLPPLHPRNTKSREYSSASMWNESALSLSHRRAAFHHPRLPSISIILCAAPVQQTPRTPPPPRELVLPHAPASRS